jgi:hypothetical protein
MSHGRGRKGKRKKKGKQPNALTPANGSHDSPDIQAPTPPSNGTPRPPDNSSQMPPEKTPPSRDWIFALLFLLISAALRLLIPADSKTGIFIGWASAGLSFCFFVHLFWKRVTLARSMKTILAAIAVLAFCTLAYRDVTERLRPSFVFIAPALWLNSDTWDFIVNHRGPKTSATVQILFIDEDRQNYLALTQKSLSSADINSYQTLKSYPEINPMGRGSIFAQQFLWKPFASNHSHFSAEITWRDGGVHQEIEIARVQEKWAYAVRVLDRDTKAKLLWCSDRDFPSASSEPMLPCFPAVTQPSE